MVPLHWKIPRLQFPNYFWYFRAFQTRLYELLSAQILLISRRRDGSILHPLSSHLLLTLFDIWVPAMYTCCSSFKNLLRIKNLLVWFCHLQIATNFIERQTTLNIWEPWETIFSLKRSGDVVWAVGLLMKNRRSLIHRLVATIH